MDNARTILVTGANGLVGYRTCEYLKGNTSWNIIGTSRSPGTHVDHQIDLADDSDVKRLGSLIRPDVIIHTASISRTDECEKARDNCHKINVGSTVNLVKAFPAATFVYFSTYAVYNTLDGRCDESCILSPLNYYIRTKIESESIINKTRDFVIIRPSVIFGYVDYEQKSKNYFMQLIDNIKNGREMKSPKDHYCNPVLADVVVEVLFRIVDQRISGVFNLGSNEDISKFEFNNLLMKRFDLDRSLLTGIDSKNLDVQRPSVGTISSEKIQETLGFTIPPLGEMIENLYKRSSIDVQKYISQRS